MSGPCHCTGGIDFAGLAVFGTSPPSPRRVTLNLDVKITNKRYIVLKIRNGSSFVLFINIFSNIL